jgi:Holliday junction resolvase-like predicted endonuclease
MGGRKAIAGRGALCLPPAPSSPTMVQINKSSRHSKITGDFAEHLVLYWLSKHGFECARVDHTGIDLIARNPHTNELMGISVKSRSRNPGTERTSISIHAQDIQKALTACKSFGCIPYFAIVADIKDRIVVFILSAQELEKLFPNSKNVYDWRMTEKYLAQYYDNSEIKVFELRTLTHSWWI